MQKAKLGPDNNSTAYIYIHIYKTYVYTDTHMVFSSVYTTTYEPPWKMPHQSNNQPVTSLCSPTKNPELPNTPPTILNLILVGLNYLKRWPWLDDLSCLPNCGYAKAKLKICLAVDCVTIKPSQLCIVVLKWPGNHLKLCPDFQGVSLKCHPTTMAYQTATISAPDFLVSKKLLKFWHYFVKPP